MLLVTDILDAPGLSQEVPPDPFRSARFMRKALVSTIDSFLESIVEFSNGEEPSGNSKIGTWSAASVAETQAWRQARLPSESGRCSRRSFLTPENRPESEFGPLWLPGWTLLLRALWF